MGARWAQALGGRDGRLFWAGRGYAETLAAHRSQACWGHWRGPLAVPESPVEQKGTQETQGAGRIGDHQ